MYNIPLVEVGEGGSEIGLGKLNLLPILNSSSSCTSGNVACKAFIRACLCMKNQFDIISTVHIFVVIIAVLAFWRINTTVIYYWGNFERKLWCLQFSQVTNEKNSLINTLVSKKGLNQKIKGTWLY